MQTNIKKTEVKEDMEHMQTERMETYFHSRHAIAQESTSLLHVSNVISITQAASTARLRYI